MQPDSSTRTQIHAFIIYLKYIKYIHAAETRSVQHT